MSNDEPSAPDLAEAGRALAETIRVTPDDALEWEPRFAGRDVPEDYIALISRTGPGTLAGALRLLASGFDGFDQETEQRRHQAPHEEALLWAVFGSGETCWWLPIRPDPAEWLVVVAGEGHQQLNLTTAEFLDEWLDGRLDLPVLSLPPVRRERVLTRPGHPVEDLASGRSAARDPLAQLQTIIGPGEAWACDWEAVEREVGVTRLPSDYKRLHEAQGPRVVLNGIFVCAPGELAEHHDMHSGLLRSYGSSEDSMRVHPEPGGLLFCASTEGRDILCWDTAKPDPDEWPVVNIDSGVFHGNITELLVAELTGTGLGMTDSSLGDPATWAWPIWGPHRPR
ncbi:hypothetical protein ACQPZP_28535 [Spirillospora sp. CA-142024]|uniref:hypothetical protein n=1 Tax=Spirillospora sp. CA-142024 TaxID=3240036 RepID=UPI003D8B1E83